MSSPFAAVSTGLWLGGRADRVHRDWDSDYLEEPAGDRYASKRTWNQNYHYCFLCISALGVPIPVGKSLMDRSEFSLLLESLLIFTCQWRIGKCNLVRYTR